MLRTGTLSEADFIGRQPYTLPNGSKLPSRQFKLRQLRIGNLVATNITVSVAEPHGSPLIGESLLAQPSNWTSEASSGGAVIEDGQGGHLEPANIRRIEPNDAAHQ